MENRPNYIKRDGNNITLQLEVFTYRDGDHYISFSPALDLSSFGNSENDSVESFKEALDLFMEDILERNVLREALML